MTYKVEVRFEDFEPWAGAIDAHKRIVDAGKADEADRYLSEIEPAGGWTDTGINDYLWFEADDIYSALGMKPDDYDTLDADDIMSEWREYNGGSLDPVDVRFDGSCVTVVFVDRDSGSGDQDSELLDEDDLCRMLGRKHVEIDTASRTVDAWD